MSRKVREISKTGVYHVMMRGNEKRKIFLEDEDKSRLVGTLFEKKKDNSFKLYAYCIMDNHLHILIKEENDALARVIKKIGTSYAWYYNRKHKSTGHVFKDRFRSEVINDDGQMLAAIKYIHNNPVKENVVKDALEYGWSSYKAYTDPKPAGENRPDSDEILEIFSPDRKRAVKLFIEYTMKRTEEGFIDYIGCEDAGINEEKTREYVNNLLKLKGTGREQLKSDKSIREDIIRHLKFEKKYSIRLIEKLLEINRNVVQRVK